MPMKFIKWVLIAVVALGAVLVGGGYFLSPKFKVTRSTVVNAPAERVYGFVASPRAWKQWSVWNQRDPKMRIEYTGPEQGTGAKWAWKSESQGDGEMTLTQAEPSKLIAFDLYFPDFGTTSKGVLTFEAQGPNTTQVTWTMNGDMGSNPLYRWFALSADSMVGSDFEAGLAGLKTLAEKP